MDADETRGSKKLNSSASSKSGLYESSGNVHHQVSSHHADNSSTLTPQAIEMSVPKQSPKKKSIKKSGGINRNLQANRGKPPKLYRDLIENGTLGTPSNLSELPQQNNIMPIEGDKPNSSLKNHKITPESKSGRLKKVDKCDENITAPKRKHKSDISGPKTDDSQKSAKRTKKLSSSKTFHLNDGTKISLAIDHNYPLYDDASTDLDYQMLAMLPCPNYHDIAIGEKYTFLKSAFNRFVSFYKGYKYPSLFVDLIRMNSDPCDFISNITILSVCIQEGVRYMTIQYEDRTFENIPYLEYNDPLLLTDPYWIKQNYFESSMSKLQELIHNIKLYNYPGGYVVSPINSEKCGLFPCSIYYVSEEAMKKPIQSIKILWQYQASDECFYIFDAQIDVIFSPWDILFDSLHYQRINLNRHHLYKDMPLSDVIKIYYCPHLCPQGIELFYDITAHNKQFHSIVYQNYQNDTSKDKIHQTIGTKLNYQGLNQIRDDVDSYSDYIDFFNDIKLISSNTKAIYPLTTMEWRCADILNEFTRRVQSDYVKFSINGSDSDESSD